jgi:hypothetical protein
MKKAIFFPVKKGNSHKAKGTEEKKQEGKDKENKEKG